MNQEQDDKIFTPEYWASKMPAFPELTTAGPPIALTPEKAAIVLANVAQGIGPKGAFALAGISCYTHHRYKNRVQGFVGNPHLFEFKNPKKPTQEERTFKYLLDYFVLEADAEQIAKMVAEKARTRILHGGTAKTIVTKTKTRTRQAILKGEIVNLVDSETTTVEIQKDRRPMIPKEPVSIFN
jgi:hypothetical protein